MWEKLKWKTKYYKARTKSIVKHTWRKTKALAKRAWEWIKKFLPKRKKKQNGGGDGNSKGGGNPGEVQDLAQGLKNLEQQYKSAFGTPKTETQAAPASPPTHIELPQYGKRIEMEDIEPDHAFRQRLASVMSDNKADRRISQRKKGKLDTKHLYRVELGEENVFTQKQAKKNKEYHVVLIIDSSGSMAQGTPTGERRCIIAGRSMASMSAELEHVGIKTTVIAFNTSPHILKEPGEKITDVELIQRYSNVVRGGTHPTPALKVALDALKHDKHGKVVCMITDGAFDPEDQEVLEGMIKAFPDVNFLGVQIGQEAGYTGIEAFTHNVLVTDMKEFKRGVTDLLNKVIKRG